MSNEPRGCLGFLFGTRGTTAADRAAMPKVQVNKYFISDAEANFFRVLVRVVDNRAHILAQVSLGQLLWFPGNNHSNPGRQTWRNKVVAKSVDFVLCDPSTLQPKLVIELDESSHTRPERQTRDDDVEAILWSAGLPLIHVLASKSYDTRELAAAVSEHIR